MGSPAWPGRLPHQGPSGKPGLVGGMEGLGRDCSAKLGAGGRVRGDPYFLKIYWLLFGIIRLQNDVTASIFLAWLNREASIGTALWRWADVAHATIRSLCSKLVFLVAPALLAQSGPMPPPPLMLFVREEVKPGHGAAHAATESAWTRALTKGKSKDHYLGMTALTGPSEAWFIMGYPSYADWEAKQKEVENNPVLKAEIDRISQQDGDHLSGTRTFLGTYRKDLSYGPAVEIGKMRYFRVRTFRVKQGQNKAFEEGVKLALDGYTKSHYAASFAFYEVTAGTGSPTFVVLRPLKSLADLDASEAADKAFQEALGEDGRKAMAKVFGDTVNGVENQLFAFNPKLSFPAPFVIASDPAFWTPKPAKEPAK